MSKIDGTLNNLNYIKRNLLKMIISISYDLKSPGRNYDALYTAIKSANSWSHPMESLWFINTSESIEVWNSKLRQVIDQNDTLFLVDITGQQRHGWMFQDVWDWLNNHNQAHTFSF